MAIVFLLAVTLAAAQDPARVDADNHKVVFQNDRLRVLRLTLDAREQSPMHEHPDSLALCLSDCHARLTGPDGRSNEVVQKAGSVLYRSASRHHIESLAQGRQTLLIVELKPDRPRRVGARVHPLDPKLYTVEVDNHQMRVSRARYPSAAKSPTQAKLPRLLIHLTDFQAETTAPNGARQRIKFESGDMRFVAGGSEQVENTGKQPFELVMIELK